MPLTYRQVSTKYISIFKTKTALFFMLFFQTFSFCILILFFYDTSFCVIRLHFSRFHPFSFRQLKSRFVGPYFVGFPLFLFVKRDVIVTDPAINFDIFINFYVSFFLFQNLFRPIIH